MANNRVNVSLAFTADTKQAKKQIDELQNTLSKLATFDHFEVGDVITEKLLKASNTVTKLQSQLKQAFNQDTGRIDLSKFKQQLDMSGMSIEKYRDALINLGPEGEQAFLGVARAIQNAEIPLRRSGKLANELWITLKNTARWQISASIIQGFQGALQKAYGYAQDLNESLNNIRIVTNYSVDDMAKFAVEANKAAKALSTTTTEYTNASLIYYQQGLSAEEVKERTDVTIKMANVSRESAEVVSDQMTAVWNNFADGSRTLEYYADVMTALGAATASSTAEITTGLEKFAAVAETVGLSYEYATTALATITDTTRQSADVVGNALKTLFARIQGLSLGETLEDGTDLTKYSEALAKVGIAIKEQDGSLKDMDIILDEMANKWGTLAKDQQVALAQTVAGVRQYTQLVALMDNWDKFQKNLSVANNASGSLQKQADIYAESWEASRERVQAALEAIFNDLVSDEFFIDLNNALTKTIGLLDQMIDNFGGLEGVIAGVGVVLTKVFNKQITQSISNFGFNLKQRWTQGSEEEQLKAKTATAMSDWYRKNAENEKSAAWGISETTITNYERISELQIQLNKDAATQSEKQREINNQFIERLQTMNDLVLASERAAKVAEVQSGAAFNTLNELQYKDKVSKPKTKKKAKQAKEDFTNNNALLGALQQFKDISTQAGVSQQSVDDLKKHIESTFKGITIDEATLDDTIAKITEKIKEARKTMLDLYNVTNETLDETGNAFKEKGSSRVVAVNSASNADHTVKETPLPEPDAIEQWSQGLTDLMSGISEVAFGLQSLSTITDTLNNQDLTWGEKTLSILQSVAFGVPSLINGLGNISDGLTSLSTGLSKLGPAIAAGKVSWLSYKVTTDAAGVSSKKLMISILGLQMSMGTFLLVIGAVAVAIGGIVAVWNAWKARQPEALLEKAKEESEGLKKALTEAKAASEDLKASIEGYDSAVEKLKDCVAGTEEWRDALQDANSQALDLLEKYPELYKIDGAVRKTGDLIDIDNKALEKVQQQYKNREYALQGAQVISQQNINDYNAQVNRDKIEDKAIAAGFSNLNLLEQAANENWDQQKLAEELSKLSSTTLGEGWMNNEITEDTFAQFDYDVAYDLVNEIRELNTEIAANSEATKFAGEAYAETVLADNKKVQNSDNKDYIEKIIGSEVAGIQEKVKQDLGLTTDQAIFNKYKEEYGLDSDAKLNSNGQVMLNGQEITNVAAMTAALTAEEMNAEIDARAAELAKTFASGNQAEIGKAIYNATGDLGDLSRVQIEALNGDESIPQALQDSITQYLTDASIVAPGLENLSINLAAGLSDLFDGDTSTISSIFTSLGEDADDIANIVNQINWSDWDADESFASALEAAGLEGKLTEEQFKLLTTSLRDSNDAVKSFNLDKAKEEFYNLKDIVSELEKGDTIKAEDWELLTDAEKEYFTLTSDGTYMLTEDAKEFYDLVMGNRLKDAKEKITELQGKTQDLEGSIKRFNYYGGDVDSLTSDQMAQILYPVGKLEEGMDLEARREAVRKVVEEYEEYQVTLEETQEFLGASARSEAELSELLGEDAKNTEIYQKHLKRLNIELAAADKALQGAAKGIRKFAPEIEDAMEALAEGMDATDPVKYRETLTKTIEKYPEWAGAIYAANDALLNATPGTQAYYQAWQSLYNILATAGATTILDEQGEKAADALEVIDSKTASLIEKTNAIANLNMMFGEGLFSPEDIGTKAFDDLRKALDGDVEAYERLRRTIAENQITTYYGAAVGSIHLEKLWAGLIQTGTLAKEVEQALLDSGMFKLVETWIDVPISENAKESKYTRDPSGGLSTAGLSKADKIALQKGLGTKKQKVTLLQPIDSKLAVETFNPSTSSGSSGSKGTKKNATDEKERYHVVNKQIEDLQAKYDKAGKEKEKAFGPAKESAALTELGYLDQLIEKERQYQAEIEQYLAKDKSALAEYGATFGEHGEIANYDALMDKEIAKYNAAIEKAGTNQEAQEAAEKAYDLFIKALENYEETYSAYLDKLATIQDLQNEKIDKELQNIQDKLDAKLDLEADQLKYLDYLIGKLDDEAYALADALVSLHDKTQPIMNQSDHYAQAWEELQRTAKENGGWTQDMIDKLRELRDGLISTNEEIMELQKTIEEKVNEAIAECTDELDKQINRFDTYQNILQNYNDIIDLSGKKFKDYAMMLELSSLMTDNAINKLASSREKLETLGQAQINAQAKLELAEDSGDQDVIDYWKKTLEDIQIEVENATAEMGSAWKEALQAASDAFESQVNLAIDNFKGGLEAFGDLDMISDSYDRAEKAAERYLEDFEKTYELSQLGRDITKAMNDTTSAFAKDELAELMAEVNEKQKDGVKMSEYDLEVLKKKFELKQAELALEETQNSMSQVRLTRDNEGNWSYQYTADQDKVDEALNEYETRLYEVAKLSDEYIDEMSKAVIDNQKEMYETLAGLRAEDFASYEEYEAKVREIVNFYTTQDAYLRDELAKAVGDTEYVTTTMSGHYDNLSTSFTTVVDTMLGNTGDKTGNLKTWMESTDNLAEQAEEYFNTKLPEAYKTWEESVGEAMKAAGTSTEDFKDDVSGYMEDIGDASEELADDIGNAAEDMQDYIESVMDAVWDWQEEYSQAIQDMIDENERLIQSMMQVAAARGAGEGNEPIADYSREIATLIKSGKYDIDDEYIQELFRQRAEKDKEGKYVKNDRIENLLTAYDDPLNPKHEDAKKVVDSVLKNEGIYFTNEYLKDHGFRTGGYTGAWGPEGKMAVLHEKELILNSDDTINFLAGVNILREIAKMIDLQAASMAMPHGFTLPMSTSSGGALEQNVHISASFPGVQDRNEIEMALRSLVNEASQFVLE